MCPDVCLTGVAGWLPSGVLSSVGHVVSPAYGFLVDADLDGVAEGALSTSGLGVGQAKEVSRDAFLPIRCFHGVGESLPRRGDGRGVTSPIAEMTGLGTVELVAEVDPKGL